MSKCRKQAQAAAIIDAANKRANALVEEARVAAVAEADKVKASALAEIEQEKNRVRSELRSEIAALTFMGAEKVLGAAVDQSAHEQLVNNLTVELH